MRNHPHAKAAHETSIEKASDGHADRDGCERQRKVTPEQDGIYSAEVADAAREEIGTLVDEMDFLVISKVELHDRLRADERASK
jgi:hypothetical protein